METWIVLIRAINVGGKNKLPMKELVAELEQLGLKDISTYIQSGNVVLRAKEKSGSKLAEKIASALEKSHGFKPHLHVLSRAELEHHIATNPFPDAAATGNELHLFFLARPPSKPDLDALDAIKLDSEHWHLSENAFYLHAPDGFGRSKLAARAEKLLGVPTTVRNWRTVMKLQEMSNKTD